ncbi:MAG: DNA primase [Coriobacteriia bacterium]
MGRIPEEDVQRVREAVDLVTVVGETVQLQKKGRLFWGLCPFHQEKTPSFKVDPANQLWHCFGCGRGGDVFGYVMQRDNLEFPDAVRELAQKARVEIRETGGMPTGERERLFEALREAATFYHETLLRSRSAEAQRAREYLASRGFGSEVAKRWGLGFAPSAGNPLVKALAAKGVARDDMLKANLALGGRGQGLKDRFFGRVMFPITDLAGNVVGFGGRVLGDGHPKYLNSQETPVFSKSRILYGLDKAKADIVREKTAVVVEGYTDVIALHEAGMKNVVATLGTALTAQHVRLLARFAERVVYLFDGDEAGRRAAERAIEFLEWQATPESRAGRIELEVAVVPDDMDPADYVSVAGLEGLKEVTADSQPLIRFVLDSRLAAHELSTPEGRAAALSDCAKVLSGLRGSILMHDYVRYVADRLLVDDKVVKAQVDKARPEVSLTSSDTGAVAEATPAAATDPRFLVERELARLAVVSPKVRVLAIDALDWISDETLKRLVGLLVDSDVLSGTDLWEALAPEVPELADEISGWIMDEPLTGDVESAFRDVMRRLKALELERRIKMIHARMQEMDPVKQKDEYDDAFREAAKLQHRLNRLKQQDDESVWESEEQ